MDERESRKVIVKIGEGLGNQLFMYAFGRAFALRHNAQFFIDPAKLFEGGYPGKLRPARNYELETVFSLHPAMVPYARFQRDIHVPLLAKFICFNRIYPRLMGKIGYWRYVEERHFQFDLDIFNIDFTGRVYFAGYWQSEKYFKDREADIRNDLVFRHPLAGRRVEMARAIASSNSVCLHVRRGDYVRNPFFNICGQDYYDRAVTLMKERAGEDIKIFVASDDIAWCRENLHINADHVFIEAEESRYALHLMSLCRNFIIPNSTFSWWAAWLSGNKKKTVVAPKIWFNDPGINTGDVCPDEWLRA
jgi:hypothetical protein